MEKRLATVISCEPASLSGVPCRFTRVSATTKAIGLFGLINTNVALMLPQLWSWLERDSYPFVSSSSTIKFVQKSYHFSDLSELPFARRLLRTRLSPRRCCLTHNKGAYVPSVSGFGKYSFHRFFTYSQNPSTGLLPHIGASSLPMRVSVATPMLRSLSASLGISKVSVLPR